MGCGMMNGKQRGGGADAEGKNISEGGADDDTSFGVFSIKIHPFNQVLSCSDS